MKCLKQNLARLNATAVVMIHIYYIANNTEIGNGDEVRQEKKN